MKFTITDINYFNNVKYRWMIIVIMFLLVSDYSVAQYDDQILENVVSTHEKVFVKLDRDVYVTGGTIRYRAFLVDALLKQENIESDVLYFQLSPPDQSGSMFWRINLREGNGVGTYKIPPAAKGGIYTLRAYTNWLRNGKPDFIFSTDILLLNISETIPDIISVPVNESYDTRLITFYPEGGTLVENIESRIGYKVNTSSDDMIPLSIDIKENDTLVAQHIVTDGLCFGAFDFLPESGKNYFAELLYDDGQISRAALPYIESRGYSLRVTEAGGGLNVTVYEREGTGNLSSRLHLMVVSRGKVLFDTLFYASAGGKDILIPSGRLNDGILYFTLYDNRRIDLCERLYYVRHPDAAPDFEVKSIRDSYSGNEKIRLDLSVNGLYAEDTVSFAVSVSEVNPLQHLMKGTNIFDYFMLSSEVIDLPVSCDEIGRMTMDQIQDLLLLAGGNDYSWNYSNKILTADCLYDREENGFILKGTVLRKENLEPLVDANILITVTDSVAPRMLYVKTDENGGFHTILNTYYDNKEIIFQLTDNLNNSGVVWNLEEKAISSPVLQTIPVRLTDEEKDYAEQGKNIHLIQEVFNNQITVAFEDHFNSSEIIFLNPDIIIYPSDYIELTNFKEIADNILPSARFVIRNRQYSTEVFNKSIEMWLSNEMILLNGVLFKDLAYIATLGSKDIRKIEVYNTNILCGELTFPGFISIYTYDGKIPDTYLNNNAFVFANDVVTGNIPMQSSVTVDRQDYDTDFPDFRPTLFWAPDMKISGTESLSLELQTSWLKGQFKVDIQGVTKSGIPLHSESIFIVE